MLKHKKIICNSGLFQVQSYRFPTYLHERGLPTYKLAKQFNCHRYTIANALKKNGIEVTNQCAKKKVLAEMIMQMYSEWYKPQEIGEALGVSTDTVRRILHDNNVYIRKSWEYPKK